ncbi:MAG TPA: endonuclease/exonuclease/phosphatase family protein [Pyrinomonadaceae bacterium]|jgi:endonuclease/exonuclease/phosphatase family metal-dependent hydrolase
MIAKLTLAALCALSLCVALRYEPARGRALPAARPQEGAALRVMTWNVGYAELEDDTRAHTKDLKAVAETILSQDPDAVALQELTGDEQLKILLGHLRGRYRGAAARAAGADRVEAVLVKDAQARFEEVPGGEKPAIAATFRPRAAAREIVLVSAHADAFSASRRRAYTERVVDWARARTPARTVFLAGDFNFELAAGDESHLYTDDLKHDGESYSYVLKFFRDLGRGAGDTAINDRRIDYVFASAEGVALRRAEVLSGAVVGRMDHSPLVVEVSL